MNQCFSPQSWLNTATQLGFSVWLMRHSNAADARKGQWGIQIGFNGNEGPGNPTQVNFISDLERHKSAIVDHLLKQ